MDISIRHVEPGDAPALREIFSQAAVIHGTLAIPHPSEKMWKDRVEAMTEGQEGRVGLVAEIESKVVGLGDLWAGNKSPRRRHAAEVGMVVHPDWHGRGVGSALLAELVELADGWLNLRRMELTVYADNSAAIRLYEKFGFEVEGTHREYAYRAGRLADALCMARIRR